MLRHLRWQLITPPLRHKVLKLYQSMEKVLEALGRIEQKQDQTLSDVKELKSDMSSCKRRLDDHEQQMKDMRTEFDGKLAQAVASMAAKSAAAPTSASQSTSASDSPPRKAVQRYTHLMLTGWEHEEDVEVRSAAVNNLRAMLAQSDCTTLLWLT